MANYFVSPGAGSNATGNGSIGNPWKSVQYALNNITQGASGDQINIQAGAADVLTATLSLSTYGTPTGVKPLFFRGYTSAANDGGKGEIDGGGTYSIMTSTSDVHFIDLKMGNCGSAQIYKLGAWATFSGCELYGSSNSPGVDASNGQVINCYVHDLTGTVNVNVTGARVVNSVFVSSAGLYTLYGDGTVVLVGNIILTTGAAAKITLRLNAHMVAIGNTIISTIASERAALDSVSGSGTILNNLFAGFSGPGGSAIKVTGLNTLNIGGNAYYNCTIGVSVQSPYVNQLAPDIALASDPFVNAAGGDYQVKSGSLAAGAAWPPSWPGLSSTTNARDIGAAQNALTIDYPIEADVRLGVDYAEAAKTGTLAVPVAGNVRAGVAVDNTTGTLGIPTVGNVRSGVQYGAANTEYTGVLELPLSGNVLTGVQYGASGTEYTGTMPQTLSIGEGAVIDIIDDLITVEVND